MRAIQLVSLLGRKPLESQIRAIAPALWLDPADAATTFQDSAGTTPAVAGDSLGMVRDKSTLGNHVTQATSTARPTLRQNANGKYYIDLDGAAHFMSTACSLGQPSTHAVAVRFENISSDPGNVFDGQSISSRQVVGATTSNQYRLYAGATLAGGTRDANVHVLIAEFNGANSTLEIDGVPTLSGNAGNEVTAAMRFGSDHAGTTAQLLDGHVFGGLLVRRLLSAREKAAVRKYLAGKAGLAL